VFECGSPVTRALSVFFPAIPAIPALTLFSAPSAPPAISGCRTLSNFGQFVGVRQRPSPAILLKTLV